MSRAVAHTSTSEPGVAAQVYQLKVTLMEVVPRIWRRVQVPACLTLSGLSATLQIVIGWEGYHLHRFEISGTRYGNGPGDRGENQPVAEVIPPQARYPAEPGPKAVGQRSHGLLLRVRLRRQPMREVRVEKIVRPNARMRYPPCLRRSSCPHRRKTVAGRGGTKSGV